MKVFGATFFSKKVAKNQKPTINKGEPPTRVLPLSLQGKEIHPLLRFTNDRRISPSAEGAKGYAPLTCASFWKSLTKTFILWFVRTSWSSPLCALKNYIVQFFEDRGTGEEIFLLRKFLPPYKNKNKIKNKNSKIGSVGFRSWGSWLSKADEAERGGFVADRGVFEARYFAVKLGIGGIKRKIGSILAHNA